VRKTLAPAAGKAQPAALRQCELPYNLMKIAVETKGWIAFAQGTLIRN
jgi:hypothetical protein